ncbi:alpha/beta fold hydrolase [Tsuneonella amylolytica]|uniref:alpha/beta fold hydrolase n=1 Tax=Tsuneonella amylolytica TaxID=2338327 RepID=UPI000EA8D5FD|nr:alpha/beta hydrolase [Tsuneonella amylolytica]
MPQIEANGITLEYEDHGDPADPVILLIMGFGAQLTLWPIELVEALVERGFRVIRYDNRDIGLSQKFDGVKAPGPVKLVLLSKIGLTPKVPYTLADMADDGAGLLDALGIAHAHIVGASMGGMIAQHFAARHPGRTDSLTLVFTATGNPKMPRAKPEAIRALTKRPASLEEDVLVEHGVYLSGVIGSPGFPRDIDAVRERTRANVRRSVYPEGPTRQMAAIIADGDRRDMLKSLDVRTLVLHGEADPLIPVANGHDVAAAIPGARIRTIPGWGHDLPLELVDEVADAVAGNAKGEQAAA